MAENAKPKGKARRGDGKESITGGRRGEAALRAKHGTQAGRASEKAQPHKPARKSPNVQKRSSGRRSGGGGGG